MTTVGEFKKKLEGLPETAPLEFWAILEKGLVELVLNPNEGIRFPRESVAEVVLAPSALRINRDKKNQRLKPPAEVANVTPAEAQEWQRLGRTAWLRAELRGSKLWADKQLPSGVKRQDVCVWMQDSDGTWCTSCGVTWEFIDGMPADNKAHFCHHCGGVLLGDGFEEVSASGPKES